jgi:hypothetical protein
MKYSESCVSVSVFNAQKDILKLKNDFGYGHNLPLYVKKMLRFNTLQIKI